MTNLVSIQSQSDAFVTVTVTGTAADIANMGPTPVYSSEQKRQYVRNVLAAAGMRVRDHEGSGHLDPIFIVPGRRAYRNNGFRAVAHLVTDVLR